MLKFLLGLALCTALRLIPAPWRPPNVEPVTASLMPYGKHMGPAAGFLFGFLSMLIFDFATSEVGMWTYVTGITFGVMGIASHFFLNNTKGHVWQYIVFAAIATIIYDFITGVLMGNLLFAMPMREAFIGQIPFSINHLIGNIVLSLVLTPLVERFIVSNKKLEPGALLHKAS